MPLRDVFRDLFREPAAERELASLGHHVVLPTFNLSTTSLRHINKWYDRLQEIVDGVHREHPNFYSDPESLGLTEQVSGRARLTKAGALFLATALTCRGHPAAAEFELIKILYYSGIRHRLAVQAFLDSKRQNLLRFLTDCHLTTNSELVLRDPKLLAIAETLPRFPGALHRFLELRHDDLLALEALGEAGFRTLWSETQPPTGLARLAMKIGSDYVRAEERRPHFLVAMLLNEIRQDLSRRRQLFDEFRVPQPFLNLVTPQYLLAAHTAYTDEIRIAAEDGRYLAFLNPKSVPALATPPITQISIRVPKKHAGRRASRKPRVRQPPSQSRVIDVVLAKDAEDYIERTILKPRHGKNLVRTGYTNLEFVLLADGSVPGADFYVKGKKPKSAIRFYEVKSALNDVPSSIRITRAEYRRAKTCHAAGLQYEVYIVVFLRGVAMPKVLQLPHFAADADGLSIDDVVSIDIAIAV